MSVPSLSTLARHAHADHLPRAIRLRDGAVLRGVVTAVVGERTAVTRVKVVLEGPERERRWLPLRDVESIGQP